MATQHFYPFVSQVCHCWCPPFFLLPCGISIHLSPRSVTAVVSPFLMATQHFYAFVSQVCPCSISIHLSPRSVTAGVRPFSFCHVAFLFICLPGLSLLLSPLFRWPRSISMHLSPRFVHVAFLFICLPGLSLLVSALFPLAKRHFYSLSPRTILYIYIFFLERPNAPPPAPRSIIWRKKSV